MNGAETSKPLRILPLGDSITWGADGSDAGYRAMLLARLDAAGMAVRYVGTSRENPGSLPPEQQLHEGHPGWMISRGAGREGLQQHIGAWLGAGGVVPDLVLLMIGTNDVAVDHDLGRAGERLDALLATILAHAPAARLLVAQITPSSDPAIDARARAYNARVAEVVTRRRASGAAVQLVDMHSAMSTAELTDDVHPNDVGFAHIADTWFEAIVRP